MAKLVNVSNGKPAKQSSLSKWSKEGDASRAVALGLGELDFAFHTGEDDPAWWCVDLLAIYPISSIRIHNRRGTSSHRADELLIEYGVNFGEYFTLCRHQGHFTVGGGCLNLVVDGIPARFIRISRTGRGCLHLSRVEVFASEDALRDAENSVDYIPCVEAKKISFGLLGTSNSIMNGYKESLTDQNFRLIKNFSVGSSHSCFLIFQLKNIRRLHAENPIEWIVVDFCVNEERAFLKSGLAFQSQTIDFIKFLVRNFDELGIRPVFLMYPFRDSLDLESPVRAVREKYKKFFEDASISYVDVAELIGGLAASWGRSSKSLYFDDSHPRLLVSRIVGGVLAENILRWNFQREDYRRGLLSDFQYSVIDVAIGRRSVKRATRLMCCQFLVLTDLPAMVEIPVGSEIVGVALNMARSNCYLRFEDGLGNVSYKDCDNDYNKGSRDYWLVCWNLQQPISVPTGTLRLTACRSADGPVEMNDHLFRERSVGAPMVEISSLIVRQMAGQGSSLT